MKRRDSGIELLRIMAMLMVVAHHAAVHNAVSLMSMPFSAKRVSFELLFSGVGKLGVVCFFLISAWFLSQGEQTLRSNLRRVWLMERELLFWSIAIYVYVKLVSPQLVPAGFKWQAVQPLTLRMWWYATFYAVFLVLLPFVQIGLKALGRKRHRDVCLVAAVMVLGFDGLHYRTSLMLGTETIFILLYAMIAYYRWYMKPLSAWVGAALVAVSSFVVLAAAVIFGWGGVSDSKLAVYQLYLTGQWKTPVIAAAFGLLLLFSRVHFYSRAVNLVASATFGVYLIHEQPFVRQLLWQRWFTLDTFYYYPDAWALLAGGGVVLLVFIGCALMDMLRQLLFRFTVDRHPARWFDLLRDKLAALCARLPHRN